MRFDRQVPVAIIGGGFSGTILAAQLARRGIKSVLVDGSGRLGKGVAYSTTEPSHLLNVRAEGMSAWAGEPDHFAKRFEAEGGERRDFAQRRLFARYLGEILDQAVASGLVQQLCESAISASREAGGWRIEFGNGQSLGSQVLVLAIGNQEPDTLRAFAEAGSRFVTNPWGANAQSAVQEIASGGTSALLVGTGLTMIDLVLSLNAAGHQGSILAVSRRGLVPRSHANFEPAAVRSDDLPGENLRAMWRWLRRRSAEVGWRAAVDSLRPHSNALWQGLGAEQQRRFLRHVRPWWDVHRHRIAPAVANIVAQLIAEGRLEIIAGRVVSARACQDGIEVEIRRRGSKLSRTEDFAYAFNCTGPLHSIAHTRDPLLRSLFDEGLIRSDHLGIGIDVDQHSRAEGGERLWALGPLTKGRYWEIVAVPDIREQAAAVADDISRELNA
jgi:uncharacterized NAD(P)/FAD-binding protein YdhS